MRDLGYCGELVRRHDRDRYFLSLLAPERARPALWALLAFNHEIAKTREVVSETQLGLIRLQWWREAIAAVYEGGDVPQHEVMTPLAEAIKVHDLPRDDLDHLIYAREFDLEDVLPSNLSGTLTYADYTTSPLFRLAVRITGDEPDMEPVHPVAVNYALAGLLRAVRAHAMQRRCYLPEDILRQNNVSVNRLYELKPDPALPEVIKEVHAQIETGVRPHNRFLRGAQALAEIYKSQIRRAGFDVFSPRLAKTPFLKELRVLLSVT